MAVLCCSDAISARHYWFEPARLSAWSCNKQVIQLMGAESVNNTDSYFGNGGTGGSYYQGFPLRPGCSWPELLWNKVPQRRQSLYFSSSFPSCLALRLQGHA